MGIIFVFLIRKVKIKGLNDSKEVSAILYITSVILAVILVVNFVLGDYIDVDGFVYGFGVATAVTIVLLFTFVPKVSTRSHCLLPFLVYVHMHIFTHTYMHIFTHAHTYSFTQTHTFPCIGTQMVGLYRDPKGEHVFDGPTPAVTSDPSEVAFLQKRIKNLEKQVELARSQEVRVAGSIRPH